MICGHRDRSRIFWMQPPFRLRVYLRINLTVESRLLGWGVDDNETTAEGYREIGRRQKYDAMDFRAKVNRRGGPLAVGIPKPDRPVGAAGNDHRLPIDHPGSDRLNRATVVIKWLAAGGAGAGVPEPDCPVRATGDNHRLPID